ncbi:MAG: hypothetical protein ACRDF5_10750 [bacterium]
MRYYLHWIVLLLIAAAAAACSTSPPALVLGPTPKMVPLPDLGTGRYLGFPGGLYPAGRNVPPPSHHARGLREAARVQPLDLAGQPSPGGRYVLLSIGMSNTSQEFCSARPAPTCDPGTFMGRAAADPTVNHRELAIVNGAQGGQTAASWDDPDKPNYHRIHDEVLTPLGLSELQVQVIWLKVSSATPTVSLPDPDSDAVMLLTQLGNILRALKVRYPNLRQVFLSSRTYGGYATIRLHPEPFAYESGFAAKWVIQAQIDQMAAGGDAVDARAGDLNYATMAPWIAWGPYLWTKGTKPRSDGLTWTRGDVEGDGIHPSGSGEGKIGALLLDFFKQSPYTQCWFLEGGTCR